ncbi:MAG: glycosyltransferase family 4 protein [Anaerolineae bacterium]|nr:glycosyltransferase family 4 protein [Anaerolineae bacterium]
MKNRIVALVVNNLYDLWLWRQPLIQVLQEAGYEVVAIGPPGPWREKIVRLGCQVIVYPLSRRGLNPLIEATSLTRLFGIYRRCQPIIAHHFTIKPNFYGTLAARLAGVPVMVATVTGLGYIWTDDGPKARLLRAILGPAYRQVLRLADAVIYLNEADRQVLGGRRTVLIPGEGIDLEAFSPEAVSSDRRLILHKELGLRPETPVVLMVSRMLRHKGVAEFVEAARRLRQFYPHVVFLLVGPSDDGNPARIPVEELQAWDAAGVVRYLGPRDDVRNLMAIADMVVLPSYREGLPRVLVEGAAMGKPLVATDIPGCREVVRHGINGLLVSPRNPIALAEAIETLLKDPILRSQMGAASRRLAEEKFSDRQVVAQILRLYAELLEAKGLPVPESLLNFTVEQVLS